MFLYFYCKNKTKKKIENVETTLSNCIVLFLFVCLFVYYFVCSFVCLFVCLFTSWFLSILVFWVKANNTTSLSSLTLDLLVLLLKGKAQIFLLVFMFSIRVSGQP